MTQRSTYIKMQKAKKINFLIIVISFVVAAMFLLSPSISAFAATNHPKIIGYSGKSGFSMFILEDNAVYSVGDNSIGQLGDSTVSERPRYEVKRINTITNIKDVETGNTHVVTLDTSGYIAVWGSNRYGQLGTGDTNIIKENIAKKEFLTSRDSGYAKNLFMPNSVKFTSIAAGGDFTAALDESGKVWTFGWNVNGQLGQNLAANKNTFQNVPTKVSGVGGKGELSDIVAIEAAETACFALDKSGNVYAFGSNYYGLMSNDTIANSSVPIAIRTANGQMKNIKQISACDKNIVALSNDGKVFVWGDNMFGQAGDGSYSSSGENITQAREVKYFQENHISISEVHCAAGMIYALATDGKLYGWGMCSNGSLGIGSYDDVPKYAKDFKENGYPITRNEVIYPIVIPFMKDNVSLKVTKIIGIDASRGYVECEDGIVRSWGNNTYGQAGAIDNGMENVFKPVESQLEMTGRFDTVYKEKNYMIVPIIVICITVALITLMFVMLSIKKKKMEKVEQEALIIINDQSKKTKIY